MTQLDLYSTDPASKCRTCIHMHRSATYCAQFVRTLRARPPAVLSCSGYQAEASPRTAALAAITAAVLSLALLAAPVSGQGAPGYPMFDTATPFPTWPPATSSCGAGCATNTPLPPNGWWLVTQTARAAERMAQQPLRVWLVGLWR